MAGFNFTSNMVVSDISEVPDKYQGLYEEVTEGENVGQYGISSAVRSLVEDYVGTNTSLDKARADKKKASDEAASRRVTKKSVLDFTNELGLEEVDDESPLDSVKTYIETLLGKVKNGETVNVNIDKIKRDADSRILEAEKSNDGKLSSMQSALNKHLIGDVATRAITAAKGSVDLLKPIIEKQCVVVQEGDSFEVRVVDNQRDARSDGAGGWLDVEGLVKELKNSDSYGRAFDSEDPGGTGANPGSMNRNVVNRKGADLNSTDKISAGLKASNRAA